MLRRNLRPVLTGILVIIVLSAVAFWLGAAKRGAQQGGGGRKVAVTTLAAKEVDFPVRRQSIGLIESPATVTILSRIDSQLVEQHVRDGQLVEKGDLLFVLDDREIRATIAKDQATIAKDEALHDQSMTDLKRARELLSRNSASQQQVDQATANQKSAEAMLAADRAVLEMDKLKLSYARIYAPISGKIGTIRITPGNLVKANDGAGGGLVTITQVRPLRVTFALPERDLPLLRRAMAQGKQPDVTIEAPNSGVKTQGKLNFMDNTVDSSSGTITGKAAFDNEEGLFWPGQYVQVDALLGNMPNVISIPTVAVQIGQKGSYVFVVGGDNTVDIRDITVLGADGQDSAVSGLKAGERIVIEGQNRLNKGMSVTEKRSDGHPETPVSEVQK